MGASQSFSSVPCCPVSACDDGVPSTFPPARTLHMGSSPASFACVFPVYRPLTKGQLVESEITSIAWNTDVPYILATGTVAGTVVVWDLKENKPWCMLRDPHRAR